MNIDHSAALPALPERISREIEDIPPLPDIVVKVLQLIRDPKATAKELTALISQDQALTSNILRLCNSAYYGMPRVVSSLSQAIMYLGFHTVRSLVLTCSLSQLFNPTTKVYGYEKGGMWYHTVACAMTCETICKKVRPDISDTAFTAGLLHDIGQLIMAVNIKDTSETILDLIQNQNFSELEAEREAVGISHDELGAVVADKWNFPEALVHTIRFHHTPSRTKNRSILTSIVHIADTLVLDLGLGIELEEMKYPTSSYAMQITNVDDALLEEVREVIRDKIKDSANQFSVIDDEE